MVEHDLAGEQVMIGFIRRQAAQAESLGDRATRYVYEKILRKTEEGAYHLAYFLAKDRLTLGFAQATSVETKVLLVIVRGDHKKICSAVTPISRGEVDCDKNGIFYHQ